jgi:hypothetical protein
LGHDARVHIDRIDRSIEEEDRKEKQDVDSGGDGVAKRNGVLALACSTLGRVLWSFIYLSAFLNLAAFPPRALRMELIHTRSCYNIHTHCSPVPFPKRPYMRACNGEEGGGMLNRNELLPRSWDLGSVHFSSQASPTACPLLRYVLSIPHPSSPLRTHTHTPSSQCGPTPYPTKKPFRPFSTTVNSFLKYITVPLPPPSTFSSFFCCSGGPIYLLICLAVVTWRAGPSAWTSQRTPRTYFARARVCRLIKCAQREPPENQRMSSHSDKQPASQTPPTSVFPQHTPHHPTTPIYPPTHTRTHRGQANWSSWMHPSLRQ